MKKDNGKKPHKRPTKKFRSKILKIFILVTLIPLVILFVSNRFIVIKNREMNIAELQNLAIGNAYEKIVKFLKEQMDGFNLVIGGSPEADKILDNIYQVNPDHLVFLLKEKLSSRPEFQKRVNYIEYTDLQGNIIAAYRRDEPIKLLEYFPDGTERRPDNGVEVVTAIGQHDRSGREMAATGRDETYIYPRDPKISSPAVTIASQIIDKGKVNGEDTVRTQGFFFAEIKTDGYFTDLSESISALKPLTIQTNASRLADADINMINDALLEYSQQIKINRSTGISDIVRKVTLLDSSGLVYAQLDTEDNEIVVNQYLSPQKIAELDLSKKYISLQTNINGYRHGLNDIPSVVNGQDYTGQIECSVCSDVECRKCKDDEYTVRYATRVNNDAGQAIGVYVAEIDPELINEYAKTVILSDMIKSVNALDPNNLIYFINSVKQTAGLATQINFVDKSGRIIIRLPESGQILLRRNFGGKRYSESDIVYPPNTYRLVDDIGDATEGEDFITAINGENYFGKPEFLKDADGGSHPYMRLASQIQNEDTEIIGVISATIDLGPVNEEVIGTIQLGDNKSGYVYVTDKESRVIACSNLREHKFSTVGEDLNGADNRSGMPLMKNVLAGNVQNGLDKFETYVNPDALEVVFAGSPMIQSGKDKLVDWYIFSEWPRDDAFSVIDDILMLSVIITLGAILLGIALGILFTQQIVKPIRALDKGAREIAKGNLDFKVRVKTQDEFELLAGQFNEMIEVLKDNRRLRDEFVFISAHELRTPVTAIKGYLSMIIDETFGPVPEQIKGTLNIVNASNERLVQLVHDLLEIARSEAGKMKIEITPVQMYDNVMIVVNECKSLAREKNIEIKYNEDFKDIKVLADPNKLKEVLTNIIGNAIKYTLDNGGIEIWHEQKDDLLITHIKDHGIGMTPEELKQLFAKFYRAQNTETEKIEGTGLGLFICKEIVERMGGEINVTSEKGKGSTFTFSLKIA